MTKLQNQNPTSAEERNAWVPPHPGAGYEPKPIDISKVALPKEVAEHIKDIAKAVHETYNERAAAEGKETHSFDDLPKEEQEQNRKFIENYLKSMHAMGYQVVVDENMKKCANPEQQAKLVNEAANAGAKDAHDRWAVQRLEDGYVYGPVRNKDPENGPLTHPDLVPYENLGGYNPGEKDPDKLSEMEQKRAYSQAYDYEEMSGAMNGALKAVPNAVIVKVEPPEKDSQAADDKDKNAASLDAECRLSDMELET